MAKRWLLVLAVGVLVIGCDDGAPGGEATKKKGERKAFDVPLIATVPSEEWERIYAGRYPQEWQFSPDQTVLAVGRGYTSSCKPMGCCGKLDLYEARTGLEIVRVEGFENPVVTLAWHPDGQRLACQDIVGRVFVYDLREKELTAVRTTTRYHSFRETLAFSCDGTLVINEENTICLLDCDTGATLKELQYDCVRLEAFGASRERNVLFAAYWKGKEYGDRVVKWNLDDGLIEGEWRCDRDYTSGVQVNDEGDGCLVYGERLFLLDVSQGEMREVHVESEEPDSCFYDYGIYEWTGPFTNGGQAFRVCALDLPEIPELRDLGLGQELCKGRLLLYVDRAENSISVWEVGDYGRMLWERTGSESELLFRGHAYWW